MSFGFEAFRRLNKPVDLIDSFREGQALRQQVGFSRGLRSIAEGNIPEGSTQEAAAGNLALRFGKPELGARLMALGEQRVQRKQKAEQDQKQAVFNQFKSEYGLLKELGDNNAARAWLNKRKQDFAGTPEISGVLEQVDDIDVSQNAVSFDRVVDEGHLEQFPFLQQAGAQVGENAKFSIDLDTGELKGNVELGSSKGDSIKSNKFVQLLRKEVQSDPVVKSASEINQAVSRMANVFRDFKNNPDKAASKNALDQALVITFNKMMDPGSVVRESEFARTPQGQAALAKAQGALEKLREGGVGLTDPERQEIVRTAILLQQGQKALVDSKLAFFTEEAGRSGVDPERIVGGISQINEEDFEGLFSNEGGAGSGKSNVTQVGRFKVRVK